MEQDLRPTSSSRKRIYRIVAFVTLIVSVLMMVFIIQSQEYLSQSELYVISSKSNPNTSIQSTTDPRQYVLNNFTNMENREIVKRGNELPAQTYLNMEKPVNRSFITALWYNNRTWQSFSRVSEVPDVYVQGADCSALFQNSASEQHRLKEHINSTFIPKTNLLSINCEQFIKERKYLMYPTNLDEVNFPLAFSIQMYRDPSRTERLLRALYRPQNVYCIHVDKKSPRQVYQTMKNVARCFPNVFVASRRVNVTRATMDNIEQEISCMEELWSRKKDWKYLVNLAGEEFPLATHAHLVRTLQSFNGSNGLHGSKSWVNVKRWGNLTEHTIPYNMTLTKGTRLMAVTRGYVDFVLHHPKAQVFKQWVSNTRFPDETFFSSLNHNPQLGVPGAHTKLDEDGKHCPAVLRFLIWIRKKKFPCHGSVTHGLCIFAVKDLPLLYSRTQMIVNKFHASFQPLAYDCMEELYYNRTRKEIQITQESGLVNMPGEKIIPCD